MLQGNSKLLYFKLGYNAEKRITEKADDTNKCKFQEELFLSPEDEGDGGRLWANAAESTGWTTGDVCPLGPLVTVARLDHDEALDTGIEFEMFELLICVYEDPFEKLLWEEDEPVAGDPLFRTSSSSFLICS